MKIKPVFALLLTLVLVLTSAVFAEEAAEETAAARTVLMSVGDVDLYFESVEEMANLLYYYGYSDNPDYLLATEYLLYYEVAPKLLAGDRLEELLGEEYAPLTEEYGAEFDAYISEYVLDGYGLNPGDDGYDEAYEAILKEYEATGITREGYIHDSLSSMAYSVLLSEMDIEVSNEEIEETYRGYAQKDAELVGDNVALYEAYTYYGYELYYMPEGYRSVLHILLDADEGLLETYDNAETEEDKAAAQEAVIASVQDTLDAIYAALDEGTAFEDLIALYNTDPGMTDSETLKTGYRVHPDGQLFVPEFTAGAFSEGMDEPGDVSKPIVSSFGVHVMYYLADVEGGIIPMTDAVREDIRTSLLTEKQLEAVVSELKKYEIRYTDAYNEKIGQKNFLDD